MRLSSVTLLKAVRRPNSRMDGTQASASAYYTGPDWLITVEDGLVTIRAAEGDYLPTIVPMHNVLFMLPAPDSMSAARAAKAAKAKPEAELTKQ